MMWRLSALMAMCVSSGTPPSMPREYTAVVQMRMPYIPLEVPMRVLTSATKQKVEYYDGLQIDIKDANGTYNYVFNNSQRVCLHSPPEEGPTWMRAADAPKFEPLPFLANLTGYERQADELVGGILCEKYTLGARHGGTGLMDDHISFYWDPVLNKPVRWHMHSRHVTFGSHTDEYIMDYLSFQEGAPAAAEFTLATSCAAERRAAVTSRRNSGAATPEALLARFTARNQREDVLKANTLLVAHLNKDHAGKTVFRANRFIGATRDEVLRRRQGLTREQRRKASAPSQRLREHAAGKQQELPLDFDWRSTKPGVVSPVKDQAMCGSCWTYALTEPIESMLAIQTGSLVELPEQFPLDCTWTAKGNSGCDGGEADIGALEIIRKYGGVLPTAAAYGSYLSVNGFCKDTRLMDVGARITAWVDVPKRDGQAVQHALVSQGPLAVSIMVPDAMLFFDSGVFEDESCRCVEEKIDHAVTLVGYGSDGRNRLSYWSIRNSWSTYWGDRGYIKIARGELDCCVSSEAGYPEVAAGVEGIQV